MLPWLCLSPSFPLNVLCDCFQTVISSDGIRSAVTQEQNTCYCCREEGRGRAACRGGGALGPSAVLIPTGGLGSPGCCCWEAALLGSVPPGRAAVPGSHLCPREQQLHGFLDAVAPGPRMESRRCEALAAQQDLCPCLCLLSFLPPFIWMDG